MNRDFWRRKRVLVTGHTGFKGSWLALWLHRLGAEVSGYAFLPQSDPSLFELARVVEFVHSTIGDVRSLTDLSSAVAASCPEIVFHLAAQSLVRASYEDPLGTYSTNVLGTANILEAVRHGDGIQAVVVVTSDKCYANHGAARAYREDDPLGGSDPYSSSKAAAELVTAAYRHSFFRDTTAIASVRAGNVIGGGDWARDRLIPDVVRALETGNPVRIRNPYATRPWQHVLDPLHGYLMLAERMTSDRAFASAWNFGPTAEGDAVIRVVERMLSMWGSGSMELDSAPAPHEAATLHLDSTKALTHLGWSPRLPIEASLEWTVRWYREQARGASAVALMTRDLDEYEAMLRD